MSFFVQPTDAPAPKTANVQPVCWFVAAVFVVMAVAQLFKFEDFPAVIASFWLPGGDTTARLLAALIVSLEVLALPFLLAMRLSPAMRVISMVAGWSVVAFWAGISLWQIISVNAITNNGVLGATASLLPGWWMVLLFLAMGVLVGWASWGYWPLARGKEATDAKRT